MTLKPVEMKHVVCPGCGSKKYGALFDVTRRNRTFTIVRCKSCGFTFQNPIPTDLSVLYSAEYFGGSGFDASVNYAGHHSNKKNPYRILHNERIQNIESLTKGRRMLDVGCAMGDFLQCAQKRGWNVYGVEISEHASEIARKDYKLNVKTGTLLSAKYPSNHFDCITMFDVIEHLEDPKKVLKECYRILRPGGVIVIETGDVESMVARARQNKWGYFIHGHVVYFSRRTLRTMLSQVGLKRVKEYFGDEYSAMGHFKFVLERSKGLVGKLKAVVKAPLFHFSRKVHVGDTGLGGMLFIYKKKLL